MSYYKAIDVAKYVIDYSYRLLNKPVSNLQLQKILYYIQHEFLKGKVDINNAAFEENMYAWKYGPVELTVYDRYSSYGCMSIVEKYDTLVITNDEHIRIIRQIVEDKIQLNPWRLVDDTHVSNGAWDRIYKNGQGINQLIPKEYIRDYVN